MLNTVLEAPFTLATTHSVVREISSLNLDAATRTLVKQMQVLRAGQSDEESSDMDPRMAIEKLVGSNNRHKFLVATQDDDLKNALNQIPGVPILSFQQVVLVLEEPSHSTMSQWSNLERHKVEPGKLERKRIRVLQGDDGLASGDNKKAPRPKKKRRVGVSGPNPLSMLKKASKSSIASKAPATNAQQSAKTKRRRSKKKD